MHVALPCEASKLEMTPKVSTRLEKLLEEAARRSVLTRTGLINRIADVNFVAYDAVIKATKKGTDPCIDASAVMAFSRTSKHLLEYELVYDAEAADTSFIADYGLLLPSAYIDIHRDIHEHGHTDYVFEGGRGSGKSSAIALEIPKLMLLNPLYECVVLRQVFNTLRRSVYPKLKWAINALGLSDDFHCQLSPLEITYKQTGQKIYFLGMDDPAKLKSFACEKGYAAIQWFEELPQFSQNDVRSANQSLTRGGSVFWRFHSGNPPRSKSNWFNEYVATQTPDKLVHHSDYMMVPVSWLGEQFVRDAVELREINEAAYRHEYLGEPGGTDGEVFQNLEIREITDDEIAACDYIRCGVDWGYAPDPFVFGQVGYMRKTKTVYILDEAFGIRLSDEQTAAKAKEIMTVAVYDKTGEVVLDDEGNPKTIFEPRATHNRVYCDNAEPKSIATWRELGINALPVKKFKGSVDTGVRWLQTRAKIVIDPRRAPLSAQEFSSYEYAEAQDGALLTYKDKDNHSIDKARYALAELIAQKKEV